MDVAEAPYPLHLESDVALRDGSTAHIRPIRADDGAALTEFFQSLSQTSRYRRFFSGAVDFSRIVRESLRIDYRRRLGLVATGPAGRILAHAEYLQSRGDTAE